MFATRHNTTRSEAAPLKCIDGSTRVCQRRYLTLKAGARLFLIAALASSTAPVWAVVTNIVGDSNRRGFPGTVDIVELHHGETNDEVLVMWSVPAGSGHDGFTIQGRRGGDPGWTTMKSVGMVYWATVQVCGLGNWEFRVASRQDYSDGTRRFLRRSPVYSAWRQAAAPIDLTCLPTPTISRVSIHEAERSPADITTWINPPAWVYVTLYRRFDSDHVEHILVEYRSHATRWEWRTAVWHNARTGAEVDGGILPILGGGPIYRHSFGFDLNCGMEYDLRIRTAAMVNGARRFSAPRFATFSVTCDSHENPIVHAPPTNSLNEPNRFYVRGGW
ncbi:MAG: hypothetical protein HRU75_07290 [Planctomycetia bacterium]|nr:MAG: hypothetical protein HRU75_07290 [Planctomycetia bacterium]